MSLGSRIRNRRKQLGLSQQQVAGHLGMGRSNFGHIENDRVIPSSTDLEKIADILTTSPNALLGKKLEQGSILTHTVSSKDIADLKKMLEEAHPILFDGTPIIGEKRQRAIDILSGLFWEAKEKEQDKSEE
ncbi:helix-turn-helix domain-containing protein [Paenibacillus sp. FSL L8-0708]|uniref:helix-turn-helix domain-containing protein n=1 Tax=Paenibacillus sp. FSL L8-0708 TaxID=2975311 RepID=UPI0030FB1C89